MIKTLQPAYNLPTRQILSGTLLQAELARVNLRIYNELAKETNCTIGKFHYYFFINILLLILFLLFVIYSKIHMIILSALVGWMGPHRRIISQNHPSILDIRCIAHCINLISSDIVKLVKNLIKCANVIS